MVQPTSKKTKTFGVLRDFDCEKEFFDLKLMKFLILRFPGPHFDTVADFLAHFPRKLTC